jgi:hypothetical protein
MVKEKDDLFNLDLLKDHETKLPEETVKLYIVEAYNKALEKAGLKLKGARDIIEHFQGSPLGVPKTSYDSYRRHYKEVLAPFCSGRLVHGETMHTGIFLQLLLTKMALECGRFKGTDKARKGGDAILSVNAKDNSFILNFFVSVKSRPTTTPGSLMESSLKLLKEGAKLDQNNFKADKSLYIHAVLMKNGERVSESQRKTEKWMSDHVWKFFTNYDYYEVMKLITEVFPQIRKKNFFDPKDLPWEDVEKILKNLNLIDEYGIFNNLEALLKFHTEKLKYVF